MFSFLLPKRLTSPYLPLRLPLEDGLQILRGTGLDIVEANKSERTFTIEGPKFSAAIYTDGVSVTSAWYDDATRRGSARGREKKAELYLSRYGILANWELRMENGWMRYWFNPTDRVAMVYGIHMDVIRFNVYDDI